MSEKKAEPSVQIIVAIIGSTAIFLAAVIGLFQPIVSKWADIYFATSTPPVAVSVSETPSSISIPAPKSSDFIYDNFNNSAYDGSFNKQLWILTNESAGQAVQANGILEFSYSGVSERGIGLVTNKYNYFIPEEPVFFEAQLKIDNAQNGHVYILVDSSDSSAYADCDLGYGDKTASFSCNYMDGKQAKYVTEVALVDYKQWCTVRIELDPSSMTYTYFLNGQKIGSYMSTATSRKISFEVGIYAASINNVKAYVDNIRVGTSSK